MLVFYLSLHGENKEQGLQLNKHFVSCIETEVKDFLIDLFMKYEMVFRVKMTDNIGNVGALFNEARKLGTAEQDFTIFNQLFTLRLELHNLSATSLASQEQIEESLAVSMNTISPLVANSSPQQG